MTKQTNYEEKFKELQGIIDQLDRQETPIDELAEKVKRGTSLIKELNQKLKAVEKDVRDAFKELEELDMEQNTDLKG
ncbi:MAG: exodeoxyribonuclease VII small subunit [Candidatus Stygibacter australis]|nr:exodeoxyribonuclease VII small subunit [Candidatus Stygibacter australis]MDP8322985.1 exodeoxyribonuclease VII small subunit [Candidatus Stygibacter australis]